MFPSKEQQEHMEAWINAKRVEYPHCKNNDGWIIRGECEIPFLVG